MGFIRLHWLFLLVLVPPTTFAQEAGLFDNGKMWTFDVPPFDYLEETYGFVPDSLWFENARLGALRIPGCSAAFVSSAGLVMTNHHCARTHITAVMREGEALHEDGFYAATLEEERRAPEMVADQLLAIHDVTAEIDHAMTDSARQETILVIEERLADEEDIHVEVIALYHGARHAAYVFRRFDDVRLVMAPEHQLGYFGGDDDNFTYPRYSLDVSFFRVYDDGSPLETENYFAFSAAPVDAGDIVFAVGNPGSTTRLATVAQLHYIRDVRDPAILRFAASRARVLEKFPDLRFSLENTAKLYEGRIGALWEERILVRRMASEQALQHAIGGEMFEQMAQLQEERRELASGTATFVAFVHPRFESSLIRRVMAVHRGSQEELAAIDDQPEALQRALLVERLRDFETWPGLDHATLVGLSPEEAADMLLAESLLSRAVSAGAISDSALAQDSAVRALATIAVAYQEYSDALADITQREEKLAADLGRARFTVYGTDIPPDATFSLRLSDGLVSGYTYNGTVAPPYTTYYGLYDHYRSFGGDTAWDLPERWRTPPVTMDLSTPLNFVSTVDITGGNSGSPLLNRDLEVVGLVFDGNIESLSGDFIYLPEESRCVAVAASGIVEALEEIYRAERLVVELQTQELYSRP